MIDSLIALKTLQEQGSFALSGAFLRVTASTVWKRVQSLQDQCGQSLVVRRGKRVILSDYAVQLLQRTEPHWQALVDELQPFGRKLKMMDDPIELRLGVSESLLLGAFTPLVTMLPREVELILSTHRSPVVWERFKRGDFDVAVCVTPDKVSENFHHFPLGEEPMCIVGPLKNRELPFYTIESSSFTSKNIESKQSQYLAKNFSDRKVHSLQSYAAIASICAEGAGVGILPQGIAWRFAFSSKFTKLSPWTRSLSMICKKTFLRSPSSQEVVKTLGGKCRALLTQGMTRRRNL